MEGYNLETQLINVTNFSLPLNNIRKHKGKATFYGMVVPVAKDSPRKSSFKFYLHDFNLSVSDLETITWTSSEEYEGKFQYSYEKGNKYGVPKNHPSIIIKNHSKPNEIITYIKNELSSNLKIVLTEAPELDRAIEFVILQSLSQGYGEILHKLHMLVIGPPTTGKSYLTKAALALNTVGQEISSSSRKVSAAGLIGTVKTKPSKNISVPGIIPNNSGGVVCLQEFHEIWGRTRKEVCGIFIRMMEEGKVIDSTSGNTLHIAETALLIDQNRYSDLNPNIRYDSYSDFDIPVPMLARFDYIISISRDSYRATRVAEKMIDSFATLEYGEQNDDRWSNNLKYLIAYLKHEYRKVNIPSSVMDKIKSDFNQAIGAMPNVEELERLVDDMRIRLMRSVIKISIAVAVVNACREVTESHVDYAMKFVQDKLDFLKSIHAEDIWSARPSIFDDEARRELLKMEFWGKQFNTADALKYVTENMIGIIDKRTINRDLREIKATLIVKKKGIWELGKLQNQLPKVKKTGSKKWSKTGAKRKK